MRARVCFLRLALWFVKDGKKAGCVVSLNVDQLAGYIGNYYSDELQVTYKLVLEDGKLYIRHRSASQDYLKPRLSNVFRVSNVTLHFNRNDENKISDFTVNTRRVGNIHFVKSEGSP